MSAVKQLEVKQGDTLTWPATRTDKDTGGPLPVGAVSACFNRLGALTVDVPDPAGNAFTIIASEAVTSQWAPGAYPGDVTFTGSGKESTETYVLIVERGYSC